MIERIEDIHTKLHLQPLRYVIAFSQAQGEILDCGTNKSIAAKIAEVLGSGNTVSAAVQGTRYLERAEVQELARSMSAGKGIAHQVRTSEEFKASIEVAFKQIIQVEGLSGAHGQYSICRPSRS